MSLDFFPCKIPISYDASYIYDACNVLVKSYSKSVVATTHGFVLVKSSILKVGEFRQTLDNTADVFNVVIIRQGAV